MSAITHQTRSLEPYDIIFSCSVCHCTISDAYNAAAGSTETLRGISTPEELGPVRVWLTDCDHVTCATHLDGGGLPFHRAGEKPKAPCPICSQEGDSRPKVLYALHKNASQNHNSRIPHAWYSFPPSDFTSGTVTAAEKASHEFQWSQLVNYGLAATKELQVTRRYGERLRQIQQQWKEMGLKAKARDEKVRLYVRAQEQKSAEWERRRKHIQAVTSMSQNIVAENDMLRRMLAGFVDFIQFRRDWALELQQLGTEHGPQIITQRPVTLKQQPSISRTGEMTGDHEMSIKRPRSEFERDMDSGVGDLQERSSSRDAMPPPPAPSSNHVGRQVLRGHDGQQTVGHSELAPAKPAHGGVARPLIRDTPFGPQDTKIPQMIPCASNIRSPIRQWQHDRSPQLSAQRQASSYAAPPCENRRTPSTSLRGGRDGGDTRAKLPPGLQSAMRGVRHTPYLRPQTLLQKHHPGQVNKHISEPQTSHDKRSYETSSQLVRTTSGYGREITTPSRFYAGNRNVLPSSNLNEIICTPGNRRGSAIRSDCSRPAVTRYANDIYTSQSLRTPDRSLASVLGTPVGPRVIRR